MEVTITSNYRIFKNGQPVQIIGIDLAKEIEIDEEEENEDDESECTVE